MWISIDITPKNTESFARRFRHRTLGLMQVFLQQLYRE